MSNDKAQTNHLYFVAFKTVDGDSQDLLVVGPDTAEATNIWREHFGLDDEDIPQYVSLIQGVTPTRAPGAIGWGELIPD